MKRLTSAEIDMSRATKSPVAGATRYRPYSAQVGELGCSRVEKMQWLLHNSRNNASSLSNDLQITSLTLAPAAFFQAFEGTSCTIVILSQVACWC